MITLYDSYSPEEMGLNLEEYKQYCEDNEIEFDEDNLYNWQSEELDFAWEDLEYEIKAWDKKHYNHYYVDASLGLWYGTRSGYKVTDNLYDAVMACINDMDYVIIKADEENGTIEVTSIHHDGRNSMTIYAMSDEDYEKYDEWLYSVGNEEFELTDHDIKIDLLSCCA